MVCKNMRLELVFHVGRSVDDVINVFRYSGEVVCEQQVTHIAE